MPVPKLPLRLLGLSHAYHLWWWKRTLARRSILTPWNEAHKAIFVHIPKTAGTSVLSAIGALPVFDTHAPAAAYAHAYPAFYADAYKFAFVRNPWDRFASSFHFMKHGTDWKMQQDWARRHIGDMDFRAFTMRLRNPLFRATVLSERFFWPQTFWLQARPHSIDEIFRFEAINQAMPSLYARFDRPQPPRTPHLRKSEKADFRDLYDDVMIDIVARLYRRDIDALGYRFSE